MWWVMEDLGWTLLGVARAGYNECGCTSRPKPLLMRLTIASLIEEKFAVIFFGTHLTEVNGGCQDGTGSVIPDINAASTGYALRY